MSAKTSAARRRAFFVALAETGNQTLAAERARVSRSWVTLHRTSDPAFQAEIDAAIATAKAQLDAAISMTPPRRWRGQDGEELTVRGSRGRWTQIARTRLKQWAPRTEARFLRALTANCNVKLACREVGLSQASAYNHRNRWVGFAERWDAAIENGYDALACALINSACAMLGDEEALPDPAMGPISVDQALHLMLLHKRRATGAGCRPGLVAQAPTMDEVRAVILRKVAIAQRAQAAEHRKTRRLAPGAHGDRSDP